MKTKKKLELAPLRLPVKKPTELEKTYAALWELAHALDGAFMALEKLRQITNRHARLQSKF